MVTTMATNNNTATVVQAWLWLAAQQQACWVGSCWEARWISELAVEKSCVCVQLLQLARFPFTSASCTSQIVRRHVPLRCSSLE
jgi:hypothetical protein